MIEIIINYLQNQKIRPKTINYSTMWIIGQGESIIIRARITYEKNEYYIQTYESTTLILQHTYIRDDNIHNQPRKIQEYNYNISDPEMLQKLYGQIEKLELKP